MRQPCGSGLVARQIKIERYIKKQISALEIALKPGSLIRATNRGKRRREKGRGNMRWSCSDRSPAKLFEATEVAVLQYYVLFGQNMCHPCGSCSWYDKLRRTIDKETAATTRMTTTCTRISELEIRLKPGSLEPRFWK
jgi:hypothetical protein